MRTFLSILVLSCLILSCRNENKEALKVEIRTVTPDSLEYPSQEIQIPDSLKNKFIENFFVPWDNPSEELLANLNRFPGKDLSYLQKYLEDDEWYGENKKPHTKWQREEVVNNIDLKNFPNFLQKGIVIAHTDLRRIPTNKPGFDRYSKAGEGFPFDYFQETGLWANTPVLIVHLSKDKQWCYVISPIYKGWVAMHDVAIVDEAFISQWSTDTYCLPLSDNISLQNPISNYAINAKMGMVLPYDEISNNPDKISVYFANTDENQNARILKAEIDRSVVALDNFKFNGKHLKQLVSNLAGRPYGWGGNLENRDCSSMIRDLLGTYKVWLPRDSKDQINSGTKYDLPETTNEKIKFIKEKGVPFLTILRKKGHNMLYVGDAPNGEPLIFHAIWGLKTFYSNEQLADFLAIYPIEGIHKDEDGTLKGRHIIGEAVITTVNAGAGNNQIITPLIDEIYAMTTILGN
ncbi:SH3 domain-containing protein [Flagellimonas sp. 389]|uniref:SH3 domain-containing C40 family peptidase n=1 Tax=Flagellimonas sp. 389 TaxID=2835862 RepID=UPI001BD61781|nr:SH3 domain-containing C40 family peptidase [Flagellimonas sp. 389]MBS9463958.1 SH3 domain-containing protein [Flagellimonas sp. 389]